MDIKLNHIYRYRDNENTPLCICMCRTQSSGVYLIVPLTASESDDTYKLSITDQYANIGQFKEINVSQIIGPLYLKSKHVKIPINDIVYIQKHIISEYMDKIETTARKNCTSILLFESIYNFLKWKHQKIILNTEPFKKNTDVYENGIYWASLGVNVGSELNKSRPVLIWKKRCNGNNEADYSYIVIPITSKKKSAKYYMNVPIDINGKTCYLRIEDMKRVNIRRISRPVLDSSKKIIFIDESTRNSIIDAIKKFYIFYPMHNDA